MQLIGMLDSPYVRRVAISMHLLGLPFEHRPISVFSSYEAFEQINPVVKAPSLVCDNGVVLMESGLILDYLEALSERSLMPGDLAERQQALHILGLALAACEKTVQIVYEQNLRPTDKQHAPWLTRVQGQLQAAYQGLDAALAAFDEAESAFHQGHLTAAVSWTFTQAKLPGVFAPEAFPHVAALATTAEQLPFFQAAAF
ncbi:glutathione S-transferase [Roseateles koreensis]|uniref:Glutathione S-transferase n=1 Tax=Roseateles koreensis TaxID=2987526 RepID=A0ABT5KSN6_9BURK|nr:glutathione S-transferase [Roseateles koreensis]MDC8785836.1 glutathione S-transferase [Roseateles koreensis]